MGIFPAVDRVLLRPRDRQGRALGLAMLFGPALASILAAGAGLALAAEPAESPPPAITGSRQLLTLFGIDQSQFDRLTDDAPWQENENEVLLKVMYQLDQFKFEEIKAWTRDDFPPELQPDDADALRGELFRLRGRVVRVEALEPVPEVKQRFELEGYFRCRVFLDDDRPALVFARVVPNAWERDQPIDEPMGARGIFLKLSADEAGRREPVFVAQRVAWYPDTPLGRLGMDVGLLDDVRSENAEGEQDAKPNLRDMRLTAKNRECFYQMLAAAGRAEPGALIREAEEDLRRAGSERFSVVPLFNEPGQQHGRLVVLSGTAREVSLVRVTDPDVQARFGIDHYYQICLFTTDSQTNPVVFCVREIPKGMPTGRGTQFNEHLTVAGFFFNKWAYRSQKPPEGPGATSQWQLAPLMIGRDVQWLPRQGPLRNPMVGAIAGGIFLLVLLAVWVVLLRLARRDRKFHDQVLSKHVSGSSEVALDRLGIDASDKPDFTGLEEPSSSDPPG